MATERLLEYDEQIKPRVTGRTVVVHRMNPNTIDEHVRRTLADKQAHCQRMIEELEKRRATDY